MYFLLKLFPKSSKISACGGHDESPREKGTRVVPYKGPQGTRGFFGVLEGDKGVSKGDNSS